MVPAIQSGIGPNFAISLGIVCGLLGATISIELGISNQWAAMGTAMLLGAIMATVLGILYGLLLNNVKGSEMTVSTYVGFSIIAFMNILWLTLPFKDGNLIWPIGKVGMRNTISLSESFGLLLNNTWGFTIGKSGTGLYVPTGLILFFLFACAYVAFMRSKTVLLKCSGSVRLLTASGIMSTKMRITAQLYLYSGCCWHHCLCQSYGFLQLYNAPLWMGFHCVAAVLIGGATTKRASIANVIIGTFLFQGILAVALPVVNQLLPESNLPDVIRLIISNGIILYAISKTKGDK